MFGFFTAKDRANQDAAEKALRDTLASYAAYETEAKPVITRERLEALEKGVTDGHADIRNKLGGHEEMIRRLDTRTLRQGKTITYKFEQRNQRQKVLEERVDAFEGRFTNLAGLFKRVGDDLAKRVEAIEGTDVVKGVNHRLENIYEIFSERLDRLEKRDADTVMKDAGGPDLTYPEAPVTEPETVESAMGRPEMEWPDPQFHHKPTAWARLDEAIDDLAKDFGTSEPMVHHLKSYIRSNITKTAFPVPTTAGRLDYVTMRRPIGMRGGVVQYEKQDIGTKDVAFAKQQGFEVIP